tara:strand:+ start:125 stop:1030 length:906 start_codon:yes stop_codon:yes gene_type:complete
MKALEKSNLNYKLNKHKKYIEKELYKTLSQVSAPKVLKEVMLYSVLNGGKRIRPFILSEICSLYKVKPSIYKYPAIAIEMAHSFSLIYDDLPCMDDDKLRRGKPSVHIAFNEANALLGASSLLTLAYQTLVSKNFLFNDNKKLKLIDNFSKAIGNEGMLAGQFLDLEAESRTFKLTSQKLHNIQKKKTGLLIAYCCYAGGYLGSATNKELLILNEFGLLLGSMFQIKDDILDIEGTQINLGKKVNKDQSQNKATIIKIKGLELAKKELFKISTKAKSSLKKIKKNTSMLSELIDYICSRIS